MNGTPRVYDWAAHHSRQRPDETAVADLASGRRITYDEQNERASRLASHLQSRGTGTGDRVALFAMNGPAYVDLELAGMKTGQVLVPLNWRLSQSELEHILRDAAPAFLLYDTAFAAVARELAARLDINHLLELSTAYEDVLQAADAAPEVQQVLHSDIAAIMYTSGTTGRPKGAIVTHGMTFWNALNAGMPARITPDTVQLVVLPLFHTGGLNLWVNPTLHAGGTVAIQRAFDPGAALHQLSDEALGITHVMGVPASYQRMLEDGAWPGADLSRLEIAGVGGAPCPRRVVEAWASRGVNLSQGYGMTETGPSIAVLEPSDAMRRAGSVGKPVLYAEVRLVDTRGDDVRQGDVGEIWTRGPHVTPGYWQDPQATEAAFSDGWFKTGDLARQDDAGFLHIVDRVKDMFISGGENVYPAEVERVILELDAVADVAVVGTPDERWGEVGTAFVVRRPGLPLTADEVAAHGRRRLAAFKVPKSVCFVDRLPRTAGGKVLKRELVAEPRR
jgi:fatty-acyl-CoA synthase